METAHGIANAYHEPPTWIRIAALLHDMTKEMHPKKIHHLVPPHIQALHHEFPSIWHSKSAKYLAKHLFNIDHSDCFLAIESHTTGRANMTTIEKIIFVADAIEPGRKTDPQKNRFNQACHNLDAVVAHITHATIQKLMAHAKKIHPDTLACWNYYQPFYTEHIE